MNNINVIDVIIVLIEWSYGIITTGLAFFAILAIVILVFITILRERARRLEYNGYS